MKQFNEKLTGTVWQVVLPLDPPITTPSGPLREISTVVVRLIDGSRNEGVGYALAFDAPSFDRLARAVSRFLAAQDGVLANLIRIERMADDGGDQIARKAIAAISLAAWDLLGKRKGMACADLWGRQRASVPAYASALFLDQSPEELIGEARGYRRMGYATVKMRGGGAPGEDAARFAAVRSVYSEPHSVAIDFVCRANVESARAFLREVGAERAGEPMWVEDPVPYGAIHELDQRDGSSRIAAGESCGTVAELLELRRAGVGMLILDVEFLGGPLRFLETARTLQALGCEVGSHMFAFESLHLLAALPGSMPVEVIDWCSALFNEKPAPDAGGRLAVRGPGFGRSLCLDTLSRYGRRMP